MTYHLYRHRTGDLIAIKKDGKGKIIGGRGPLGKQFITARGTLRYLAYTKSIGELVRFNLREFEEI